MAHTGCLRQRNISCGYHRLNMRNNIYYYICVPTKLQKNDMDYRLLVGYRIVENYNWLWFFSELRHIG